MASKIQVKRGNKSDLPILSDGEYGFCQDTSEIFIGNGGTNTKIYPTTSLDASSVTVEDIESMFESVNVEGVLSELGESILDILNGATTVGKASDANTVGGFTVGVSVPANAKFTDTVTTVTNNLTSTSTTDALSARQGKQLKDDLDEHKADEVHQGELHGLRLTDGKLEYFDGLEWQRIKGDGYPVGNISNFETKGDNNTVDLTWTDPPNVTVTDSLGNLITIARWKGTKILRKSNSYPQNENDGVLVVDNGIRDQYKTNGFTDTGLINDRDYYYMAFPYTEEDVFTVDVANRIIGTPSDVDDKTTAPGPKKLLAGDMSAGYFGVVPASELYTGAEISSACGISQGTLQFSDVGWLKFAIDGKIIFKSQKTYRHSISWDHINGVGAVKGTKQVTKSGNTYKVRLMKGALTDPSAYTDPDRGAKGSEWNRLMLPIHIKAKDKSWAYPAYVEDSIPYWGIDFTDADLQTISSAGDGSYHWCQEVRGDNATTRVVRGLNGVSGSAGGTSSGAGADVGWSPVLEWVS